MMLQGSSNKRLLLLLLQSCQHRPGGKGRGERGGLLASRTIYRPAALIISMQLVQLSPGAKEETMIVYLIYRRLVHQRSCSCSVAVPR